MSMLAVPCIGPVTQSKPLFAEIRARDDFSAFRQVAKEGTRPKLIIAARRGAAVHLWQHETIDLIALERYGQSEHVRRTKHHDRHRRHKQRTHGTTERSGHLRGGARTLGEEGVSLTCAAT